MPPRPKPPPPQPAWQKAIVPVVTFVLGLGIAWGIAGGGGDEDGGPSAPPSKSAPKKAEAPAEATKPAPTEKKAETAQDTSAESKAPKKAEAPTKEVSKPVSEGARERITKGPPGSIAGTVIADNGRPLPEAMISLKEDEGDSIPPRQESVSADGTFLLTGVPEDIVLRVDATLPGTPHTVARRIRLTSGRGIAGLVFKFAVGSRSVAGEVVNPTGAPLGDARIALEKEVPGGEPERTPFYTKSTADGRFALPYVPEGKYLLVAQHRDYCDLITEVQAGDDKLTVVLPSKGVIRGRVLENGSKIPDSEYRVIVRRTSKARPGPDYVKAEPAADGAYYVELKSGTYDLAAVTNNEMSGIARGIELDDSGEVTGADIPVKNHGRITGQVLDESTGKPIAEARVSVSFGIGVTGPFRSGNFGGARTDDKGRFSVSRLPNEPIRLTVRKKGYAPWSEQVVDAGTGKHDAGEIKIKPQE